MDEQRLTELFQTAAQDVPPASFDQHDIATAANRVTVRRRSLLAGGGGLAGAALVAGLLLGTGVLGHTAGNGLASGAATGPAGPALSGPAASSSAGPLARVVPGLGGSENFPGSSSMQGGVGSGGVGHGADSTHAGCGPADGELAVALAGELPSAGASVAVPASVTCPPGSRSAAVAVPHGTVVAVLTPRADRTTPGAATASGRWVVSVFGEPATAVPSSELSSAMLGIAHNF